METHPTGDREMKALNKVKASYNVVDSSVYGDGENLILEVHYKELLRRYGSRYDYGLSCCCLSSVILEDINETIDCVSTG